MPGQCCEGQAVVADLSGECGCLRDDTRRREAGPRQLGTPRSTPLGSSLALPRRGNAGEPVSRSRGTPPADSVPPQTQSGRCPDASPGHRDPQRSVSGDLVCDAATRPIQEPGRLVPFSRVRLAVRASRGAAVVRQGLAHSEPPAPESSQLIPLALVVALGTGLKAAQAGWSPSRGECWSGRLGVVGLRARGICIGHRCSVIGVG